MRQPDNPTLYCVFFNKSRGPKGSNGKFGASVYPFSVQQTHNGDIKAKRIRRNKTKSVCVDDSFGSFFFFKESKRGRGNEMNIQQQQDQQIPIYYNRTQYTSHWTRI